MKAEDRARVEDIAQSIEEAEHGYGSLPGKLADAAFLRSLAESQEEQGGGGVGEVLDEIAEEWRGFQNDLGGQGDRAGVRRFGDKLEALTLIRERLTGENR